MRRIEGSGALSLPCVLVVDDDAGVRYTLEWALEDAGFGVITASNGREALDRIAAQPPDLVVLDMAMPVLDGYGFTAELRRNVEAAIPIIVLTADGRAAQKAARVGAIDFIQKPFDIDDLIHRVSSGLAST